MFIRKLKDIDKTHFSKRLKNNNTENTQAQRKEPKKSFADVLEREKEKLREE